MKKGQKLIAKHTKTCPHCRRTFYSARIDAKTCSPLCRNALSLKKRIKPLHVNSIIFNVPSLWDIDTSGLEVHHIKFILKKRSVIKLKKFISISIKLGFRGLKDAIDIFGFKFKENEVDCKLNYDTNKTNNNIFPKPNILKLGFFGLVVDTQLNRKPTKFIKPISSDNSKG